MQYYIEIISPLRPDVNILVRMLNEHNLSLCPPEACHLDTPEQLVEHGSVMVGAFLDSTLCGIGAIKFFDGYGELKRMFVTEGHRKHGLAHMILNALTDIARERGITLLRLETSEKFVAAVTFYSKNGFTPCDAFGSYAEEPQNFYMEKRLNDP